MEIYLIRHAIAEERENWHQSDDLRPLTERGEKKMQRAARALRAMEAEFTHLYSSPLTRAMQTADIVRKASKLELIHQTDALTPEAPAQAILPVLNNLPANAVVGLVGHEPHLGHLLSFLLSGQPASFAVFKKGGMACLESEVPVQAGRAILRWLLEPAQLVAIGE